MIGNDVVDLSSSESRDIHPRFDELALTPAERARLPAGTDHHLLRWQFWSAKEATYKLLKRLYPNTSYVPRRFEVLPAPCGTRALVHHGYHGVQVRWQRHRHCIHAIAQLPGQADRSSQLFSDQFLLDATRPGADSSGVRRLALDSIAARTGLPCGQLRVRTRHRIPDLVTRDGQWLGFLSLSHHGGYGAYACLLGSPALPAGAVQAPECADRLSPDPGRCTA